MVRGDRCERVCFSSGWREWLRGLSALVFTLECRWATEAHPAVGRTLTVSPKGYGPAFIPCLIHSTADRSPVSIRSSLTLLVMLVNCLNSVDLYVLEHAKHDKALEEKASCLFLSVSYICVLRVNLSSANAVLIAILTK